MKQMLYGLVLPYQDTKYGWNEVYSIYVWAENEEQAKEKIEKVYDDESVADITGAPFDDIWEEIFPVVTSDEQEYVKRSIK